MKLTKLFHDDEAVSPVIGVILMVAITVILAAVIGTFVLGLGNQVQSSSPTASISFDQQGTAGNAAVTLSHDGGDSLQTDQTNISAPGGFSNDPIDNWDSNDNDEITAGESVTVNKGGSGYGSGDTIKVVWTADGGESSNVLAEYEVQ